MSNTRRKSGSNDWKVAIISGLCAALLAGLFNWFTIHYQLERGQNFWMAQQRISSRDTKIKAQIAYIQDIERLGLQHGNDAFYHMVGHLHNIVEYAYGKADATREVFTRAEHSKQLSALYQDFHLLISRLRSARFLFDDDVSLASEQLIAHLESSNWHPVLDMDLYAKRIETEIAAGRNGFDAAAKLYPELEMKMERDQYYALLRAFIDIAMKEVKQNLRLESSHRD